MKSLLIPFPIIAGDAADGMYFIEEGTVSVRMDQDNSEIEISKLGKGQYFGELALVTHRPRAASVYATGGVVKLACKSEQIEPYIRIFIENLRLLLLLSRLAYGTCSFLMLSVYYYYYCFFLFLLCYFMHSLFNPASFAPYCVLSFCYRTCCLFFLFFTCSVFSLCCVLCVNNCVFCSSVLCVVLDVVCFERLLGRCSHLLQRGIRDYRYLEQDLRAYFESLLAL